MSQKCDVSASASLGYRRQPRALNGRYVKNPVGPQPVIRAQRKAAHAIALTPNWMVRIIVRKSESCSLSMSRPFVA